MIKVKIETAFIKLEQFMKFQNITSSGGEAKNLIQDCLVKVNDQVETQRGKKLRVGDIVEFDGEQYEII